MPSTKTEHSDSQRDADSGVVSAPEHLLSLLLGMLNVIVWELDAATFQCVMVSQRAQTMLGYGAEQWQAAPQSWVALVHPADRARVLACCAAAVSSGHDQTIEYRMCAADGRTLSFRVTLHLLRSDAGAPARLQGVMLDLTERKQLAAALHESETRFREVAENSTDMISRHALDGTYRYVSPACLTLLGYTPAELLGTSAYDFFHPDDIAAIQAVHTSVLEQPIVQSVIYRIRRKDGQYTWFETTTRALHDPQTDAIVGIYAASRDISERKRAEEDRTLLFAREQLALAEAEVLRKTDRLKSEFLASVSHELRTPLHHIKGYATTLLRSGLHFDEHTTRDYLRIIAEESDKLERLIGDLLDTSRIETDMLALDIDSIQLDELVRDVVRHWQGVDAHHFEAIMPADVPPIPADAYRIQQVLNNLLANVVRHTPANTMATVTLQVTREDVMVTVRDYGPGIGAEHLPHLFERFYQAEPQIHRRLGSGLGLFICKGIIEQHGGSMCAQHAESGGALFQFSLPRRRAGGRMRAAAVGAVASLPSAELR